MRIWLPAGGNMIKDSLQTELNEHYNYGSDDWVRYSHRLRINQLKELIKGISREPGTAHSPRALDAGCGSGVYSILLAEAGYKVLAINIDEEEINQSRTWAKEKGFSGNIEFRLEDLRTINSPESAFDLIVCSEVLEHIDDSHNGAKELYRVLAKGGKAIISMPNMASLLGCMQLIFRKSGVRTLLRRPPLDHEQLQHSRFWFGNITKMLKEAGFKVEYRSSTYLIPFLWHIDNVLKPLIGDNAASYKIDHLLSRTPALRYTGYSFIIVATKEA